MPNLIRKNGKRFPSVDDFFDVDTFFKPFLSDLGVTLAGVDSDSKIPSVNISETEKEFKIEMAAPGFDKNDFNIETQEGMLTISAEKKSEEEEEKKNYHRKEFTYSRFSRSFQLPENSLDEKIEAKYADGILKITLPKKEVTITKPKKEIKVS